MPTISTLVQIFFRILVFSQSEDGIKPLCYVTSHRNQVGNNAAKVVDEIEVENEDDIETGGHVAAEFRIEG